MMLSFSISAIIVKPNDGKFTFSDLFFIIKNDKAGKYPVLGIDRVKFNLER